MRRFMKQFARDQRGGAVAVLAFVTLAVAIIGGLTAAYVNQQQMNARNEIARASESAVRTAVDSIVVDLNTNGFESVAAAVDAADDGYVPAEFVSTAVAEGAAKVTSIERTGETITMHLVVESTGTVKWKRETDAQLHLAGVRSVGSINDDGTIDWDYEGDETGIDDDYLAVWSPVPNGTAE